MEQQEATDQDEVEQQLKDVIQDLYQIMVQVSAYDTGGRSSRDVLVNEIKTLSESLQAVYKTTASPACALASVPPELLEYVENGRNPDIYTREFVELVRRGNQVMRGKQAAFGALRDVFAAELAAAMPELRPDIDLIRENTGAPPLGAGDGYSGGGAGRHSGDGGGGAEQRPTTHDASDAAQPPIEQGTESAASSV